MISYWERKQFYYHRSLIVCGAGFTGLSAAIYYKRKFPDREVLVLEMDTINGGASTKNAGFACFGSPSELLADLKVSTENDVFTLVEKRFRGLQNLRDLLGDEEIGYEHNHGFELYRLNNPLYTDCAGKIDYLNGKIKSFTGYNVYSLSDKRISEFGFKGVEHIIENSAEAQVDTGKMYASLLHLVKDTGIQIFNGVKIESFEENNIIKINTSIGIFTCDQFLIANNGFASQILNNSETKPARAQVLVTSPIKDLKVKGTFHLDKGFYYFRNIDERILFGGGRNTDFKMEATTELAVNEDIQDHLENILHEIILPDCDFKIEQRWAGIMGMGDQKLPIVKRLSEKIYCAIRLSGMGLALSTLLGNEVVEMMD